MYMNVENRKAFFDYKSEVPKCLNEVANNTIQKKICMNNTISIMHEFMC